MLASGLQPRLGAQADLERGVDWGGRLGRGGRGVGLCLPTYIHRRRWIGEASRWHDTSLMIMSHRGVVWYINMDCGPTHPPTHIESVAKISAASAPRYSSASSASWMVRTLE